MSDSPVFQDTHLGGTTGGFLIVNIDKTSVLNMTFIGLAEPGSATSSDVWKIMLIDKTGAVQRIRFAEGNTKFSKVWDNRVLGYAYS